MGKCIDGINDYTCTCDKGYTGRDCDIEINECESQPCMNGGVCYDFVARFYCACPAGFFGDTCEKGKLQLSQFTTKVRFDLINLTDFLAFFKGVIGYFSISSMKYSFIAFIFALNI